MPRHVEGDDPKIPRHFGIVQDTAILPAIGTSRMQADQRYPLARLLEIDPVAPALELEREIAADDCFERGSHCATPFEGASARGASSTAFR